MTTKLHIIFYSMYGHVYQLAEAIAAGAREVEGVFVELYKVPELVPEPVLEQSGAKNAQKAFEHIPIMNINNYLEGDAFIFGTPTRFGNMCSQMRNHLDQLGELWMRNAFVGKIGSVFTSTGSQHGGQETTLTSFHTTLLHLGMIIAGLPYTNPYLSTLDEVMGGTPYGATTITGLDGKRMPAEKELAIARFQGKHVATLASALKKGSK